MKLLKRFLSLPVIIGPFPNQIVAGQLISALPVMNNFNWLRDQFNANIATSIPTNAASIPTFVPAANVGGTANAITLTPTPAIAAYVAGNRFSFPAAAPNTGATTVNVSGLGTKNLLYADATALSGSELLAGGLYDIEYNGTAFNLLNSSQGSAIITWTPTLTFGGASVGITYGTRSGKAWKFGRMMYFSFLIVLTNRGSSSGGAMITGLPFTVNAGWAGNSPGPTYVEKVTFTDGYIVSAYQLGTTTMFLVNIRNGTTSQQIVDTDVAHDATIAGNGFYVV